VQINVFINDASLTWKKWAGPPRPRRTTAPENQYIVYRVPVAGGGGGGPQTVPRR